MSQTIPPEAFRFLRRLKKNNNREWFNKNKDEYVGQLRDPLLQFISDFTKPLARVNSHFVADSRTSGGSLFRIYRDTRFSKDKTPYKTSAGIHFRHESAASAHAPGFYLHLEPGGVFAAAGMWRPDSAGLRQIRDRIVEDPRGWKRAVSGKAFVQHCRLEGDSLKRPPKGYDPENRYIDDLKRKDFITSISLTENEACAKDFAKTLEARFKIMKPLVGFLSQSIGVAW